MIPAGKAGPRTMDVVYASLGRRSGNVVVGPGKGLDNAVVSVGSGRVLILTVDPVSAVPAIGMKRSAWLGVHLIASDFTASGADPEFATFSYNFPQEMSSPDREEYVRSIGAECRRLGVSIVGGNTGTYPGGGFTVIGTGSMLGLAPEREYVTPAMTAEGDSILITKRAAIEATCWLALSFPKFTLRTLGRDEAKRAREAVALCSTVEDARNARRIGLGGGAVTAMHDCTEGGVLGALGEMAGASGKLFEVQAEKIPVSAETRDLCRAFHLEPLSTMGEGALLITCDPQRVAELQRRMTRAGIPVAEIGRVRKGRGLLLREPGDSIRRYVPRADPYWEAFQRGADSGLG